MPQANSCLYRDDRNSDGIVVDAFTHRYSACIARAAKKGLRSQQLLGGCQNYGPFLGTLNIRGRIIMGTQKRTIILTTILFKRA